MSRVLLCLLFSVPLVVMGGVLAWAAPPVIQDVSICSGRDTDAPDWAKYHRRAYVRATDGDGAGDITSIIITDSDGVDYFKAPGCGCWWQDDDYTISASLCAGGEELDSAPGGAPYTIAVTDASSNTDSLVTAVVAVASDVHPVPVSPVMDSVIYDTTPTFEWNAGLPGSWYGLHLEEEGTLGDIWFVDVGEPAEPVIQVPYDGELKPNHAYFLSIDAWRPEDVRVSDPRVEIWTSQWTRARFTVHGGWPEIPPDLPGQFAYNAVPWAADIFWTWGMPRVVLYDTDPNVRTWLQSDWTWFVRWCADGTKSLFVKKPGIWIDYQDGSDPVQIPNLPSWGDASWAPDGQRVVFQFWGPENPDLPQNYDIWVASIDGTNVYPLVESFDSRDQFPVWSPDGLWIAYRKLPDPDGVGLHLVRYDGTEDHAVVATGVVGYPDYYPTYMGEQSWSPDGLELAVNFIAEVPGAVWPDWGYISGIGTLPREGGTLTPVFVAPEGAICCAQPHSPGWSPDGTQIVFTSGHHLAPEELPGQEEFCPSTELWLVNAVGSGDPIRLTYDHSFNQTCSWWAPNTEPGGDVEVVAGDTTVTFENVTGVGTTTAVTLDDPPGPTPEGFQFLGDYYDISTDADISGTITIEIHYDDADVPGGEEEWLSLLHWESGAWVDITVRPIDTVNNIITGQCTSLSEFGIAFGPQFVGLLQPINNDGSSIFKLNRTVPVKFQLVAPDGSYVSDAVARLYVAQVTDEVVGSYEEPDSTSAADTGNTFRYDAEADQYIFNLGTKGLSTGTWVLQVVVNGLVEKEVLISLR
jgi:hypothetical protein